LHLVRIDELGHDNEFYIVTIHEGIGIANQLYLVGIDEDMAMSCTL
jgi:hypothetical protein